MNILSIKTWCFAVWILLSFFVHTRTVDQEPVIPKGQLYKRTFESRIFTGTVRDYWIYVPAQYDSSIPANVMIFQDGEYMIWGGLEPITTLDQLIHNGEIPIVIGVFINYGYFPNSMKPEQDARMNRSFEYDTLNDTYAKFLDEEILPEVDKDYNLVTMPEGRAIVGHSSGAICAWTVAWERSDLFRKVISLNGSFVNIRGGDRYPYRIRNTDPKPIKILLFTGEHDADSEYGNWTLANEQMAAALKYAGYEYRFVIGEGNHDIKHAAKIFPEALRWIWSDYKKN
jgi:enterochelin esterase-like enzyme